MMKTVRIQDDKGGKHWSEMESNMGGFATKNVA